MIPHGVDIADLSAQLEDDRLAFGPHAEFARQQEPQLEQAVATVNNIDDGQTVGVALVDVYVDKAADLRDLAQELQRETELDTVIVRTPHGGSAVSEHFSRANLEAAETAFKDAPIDVGVVNYVNELSQPLVSWPIVAALAAIVILSALTISWILVTKSLRD